MKIFDRLDDYVNDKKYSMIYKYDKLDIINYSEILEFTSNVISIRYNDKIFHIKGNNLVISRMLDNEILISGDIENISLI